ncbi:MAG TPA: 23S rRNA (adenine(2503)-C(2))-methyltransferase RlmN [Candidatus Binataceae bacterium]|nr:23S rRNA (adenine(2503)-C(2))-methyltransferase RlmN [Candidatus Binataceae bacterium]
MPHRADAERRELRDLLLEELEEIVTAAGERKFRARQIMAWLWTRAAESFDTMGDVPAALRRRLAAQFSLATPRASAARSIDGTRKLLVALADGEAIESVLIPARRRLTLCLSSQVGCAMGCEFCATARMGLHRNLMAAEMAGQVIAARGELAPDEKLTNFVFMGMGEPLANYPQLARTLRIMTAPWGLGISPRRITVSTVGLIPGMERLLAEFQVNLAVSLHATTDETRGRIVPVNRRFPLAELIETCRRLPIARRNRITFEYVMLDGINDSDDDAQRLVKLMRSLRAKVNLLFFNPFAGSQFRPSPRPRVEDFLEVVRQGNLTATLRESRGRDIAAACGQLYAERAGLERRRVSRLDKGSPVEVS